MIDIVAVFLAGVLAAIAMLHLYWALGGFWPGHDEASLAQAVVGTAGIQRMPPVWMTVAVVLALFAAALWPLMWAAIVPYVLPQTLVVLGMWVLATVFLLRGIAGYTPVFGPDRVQEPFLSLNRRLYAPLCFLIGSGFVLLIVLARL